MRISRESTREYGNRVVSLFVFIRDNSRLAVVLVLLIVASCRSRVVQVTITNTSTQPVSNIIVDYPAATFGKNTLAPGDIFQYAIKPVETGVLKVQFTNAQGVNRSLKGTTLHKDQEGSIEIKINQDGATVNPALM